MADFNNDRFTTCISDETFDQPHNVYEITYILSLFDYCYDFLQILYTSEFDLDHRENETSTDIMFDLHHFYLTLIVSLDLLVSADSLETIAGLFYEFIRISESIHETIQ